MEGKNEDGVGEFKATPLCIVRYNVDKGDDVGVIGKWTEVKEEEQFLKKAKVEETQEEKVEREKDEERLREEVLNVHKGVKPKKQEAEFKLSREELIELAKAQSKSEDEEFAKLSQEEKSLMLRKKTERMRDALARQKLELVEKPVYHEDKKVEGEVQFKKRVVSKKRKAPESESNQ
eukprot:TRINITY_DN7430_c0_g1_i4.p1 TRINITY_DN7430_c0_g1~~TRINITY_DN7430_c0_g1_i4.p1  ORF type:complete len:177 (+),score=85.96 TRINITY_DN7430_c0_g1_i4:336-866(+)